MKEPDYSLEAFNSPLNFKQLHHLLRRCLFGVNLKDISFFESKTAAQCLQILLTPTPPLIMLPQADPDVQDPLVPIGKPWINASYENDIIDKRRRMYLKSWWVGNIINRDYSLTEKMTLFWHNHFVTEMDPVGDARFSYKYVTMLRKYALGNSKSLILEGTTQPAMLVYLNGNSNVKEAPNENYSRELMELFTLGKANKQNYNEEDVRAAARVLTGWKSNKENITSDFHPELHDTSDKHFSSFFNNYVIKGKAGGLGADETKELIDMIFSKQETAMFICRNIYRWFVSARIDDKIEAEIIAPLANVFVKNNFEIRFVLNTLLNSKHFFDESVMGCIVKSPVDFFVGVSKQMSLQFPKVDADNILCWIHYNYYLGGLSQFVGDPPSVAGWTAYYQPPKYHQWWINSATLGFRKKIIESLASTAGMSCNGPVIRFDFTSYAKQFSKPDDAALFTDNCLRLLLAVELDERLEKELIALLAGKQNEKNWTTLWQSFVQQPNDTTAQKLVENRLQAFFVKIFNLPEFQMI